MAQDSTPSLAALVASAEAGDAAAKDALFAALYAELHRLAEGHVYRAGGNITLGATTLLHEAYLRIADRDSLAFPDRNRFLAYASRAMRGLVLNYLRGRRAEKRGGELTFTTLDEQRAIAAEPLANADALEAALAALATTDPALAELVDLRFFCGFTFDEIAAIRGLSVRTVHREWAKARLLLHEALAD
ncbi:ECF-type sigma factor [Luteitalea sp.]|uniref:ECF-type sigma factor n=1 Tax=Luteitalea sp. TaxID=2004800 RepID=UPI0025BD4039|nr:ECF-type sigma factor [Luteitalea sp.]